LRRLCQLRLGWALSHRWRRRSWGWNAWRRNVSWQCSCGLRNPGGEERAGIHVVRTKYRSRFVRRDRRSLRCIRSRRHRYSGRVWSSSSHRTLYGKPRRGTRARAVRDPAQSLLIEHLKTSRPHARLGAALANRAIRLRGSEWAVVRHLSGPPRSSRPRIQLLDRVRPLSETSSLPLVP
jgi:hypothetical protein